MHAAFLCCFQFKVWNRYVVVSEMPGLQGFVALNISEPWIFNTTLQKNLRILVLSRINQLIFLDWSF